MRVYCESNFVVEVALQQEECGACEDLIQLAEQRRIRLILPAFALFEPYGTLRRRDADRIGLLQDVAKHAREVGRIRGAGDLATTLETVTTQLSGLAAENETRFYATIERLLSAAIIVPVDDRILQEAVRVRPQFSLTLPDAIVFASVIRDAERDSDRDRVFLNKNRSDFATPDVEGELRRIDCRLITRFSDGLAFVRSRL